MKKKTQIQQLFLIALPLCVYMGVAEFGITYELPKTKYLLLLDRPVVGVSTAFELKNVVEIKNGMDLSHTYLEGARINWQDQVLEGVNFSRAYLENADLRETRFKNCSFKGANLTGINAYDSTFVDCDFEDAIITKAYLRLNLSLTQEQLRSTWNYKNHSLIGVEISMPIFSGLDFSGFTLLDCTLGGDLSGCNFTNARVSGTAFGWVPIRGATLSPTFSKEQLMSTSCFKRKKLMFMKFGGRALTQPVGPSDLPEADLSGLNLEKFNLTGTQFSRNLENTNLTDAVITDCNFFFSKNLTLDQIKSTWNYKTGNMAGLELPRELQEALEAERQAKEESP